MESLRRQSLAQTTANHLRAGFASGHWRGLLPGVRTLAAEIGVSKDTVRAALQLLEADGTLKPQGSGKNRQISRRRGSPSSQARLRVALLLPGPLEDDNTHTHRIVLGLRAALEADGHACVIVCLRRPTAPENHRRAVARLVTATEADAWVLYSARRGTLEWFISKSIPVLALGGHFQNLPVASSRTDLTQALNVCVDALVKLGHRRIVLIGPEWWRKPEPNFTARAFLLRLAHHGLLASEYNLPDWEETPEGLEGLLNGLFLATPPTALLIAEPAYCSAVRAWLGEHHRLVPRDVSLVNFLPDAAFQFHRPPYTAFQWPEDVHIRRIQRWVQNLVNQREDREAFVASATFDPGGTIGPVRQA